jgi:hypothetical protein
MTFKKSTGRRHQIEVQGARYPEPVLKMVGR